LVFRILCIGWLACAAWSACAAVPVVELAQARGPLNLGERMETVRLDASAAINPDTLWDGGVGTPVPAGPRWQLVSGQRMIGRVTLTGSRERDTFVVEVPAATIDDVQVWHREAGGAWKGAVAGDRVPLSRWPFAAQFPAFPIIVHETPVDLIVTVANSGPLRVVVSILPDAAFRESRTRSANLSGLIMGLGAMVGIVCLLGALTQRRRANWLLAAVSWWTLLTVGALNGYLAVWFTPDAAAFNDASKHFTGVMLGALMVALTAHSLDPRYLRKWEWIMGKAVPAACLVWATMQAVWLPLSWRAASAAAWGLFTLACCVTLCALSSVRGGRQTTLVSAGVGFLAVAWALALVPRDFDSALDFRAASVGICLYSALLLFRQAVISRDRYGRDVLGRAAVSANRDPLTALLSYAGFELAYEQALLRQGAGAQSSSMMLFLLPGLEKSGAEHGYVITERALVRFAAALQAALGDAWSIARLSKTRFACISTLPYNEEQVIGQATQVLARCGRISRPLQPLADFGLRIACLRRPLRPDGLADVLLQLEQAALAMDEGKRIAFL
jgi:GGDEF domain-containing protein